MDNSMTTHKRRILIVDDNRAIHEDFRKILDPDTSADDELAAIEAELFGEVESSTSTVGFEIDSAFQGEEGIARIREAFDAGEPYTMAFVDVRMPPGIDGVVAASQMLAIDPHLQVVICSAHSDHDWTDILDGVGDHAVRVLILRKPFESIEARQLAFSLSEKSELSVRAAARMEKLDQVVKTRTEALSQANETLRTQIEERERVEAELRIAQKLEAVGQLAAGVAHEINTPIQFVGDNLTFLKEAVNDLLSLCTTVLPVVARAAKGGDADAAAGMAKARAVDIEFVSEQLPEALEESFDGVERVSRIVRAMKEFAYPDQGEASEADINQALRNTLTVASNEYKLIAEVDLALGTLPPVSCFLGDLNQVFLNLVVNAAHAIAGLGSQTKGKITISTRIDGDDVVVDIADTGGGIPEAVADRIFEPFFTTKEVGKGTGQGLAIAHRIVVDKHGGHLTFDTEPGKGTTFHIRIPIAGPCAEAA